MVGQTYRMDLPTLGIHMDNGRRVPVMIPLGSLIVIKDGPPEGTRLVDVLWGHVEVMMFPVDIHERGTLLEPTRPFYISHRKRKTDSV